MSSSQEYDSEHNPVNELVNYLRKDTPFEEVSTTTPSVTMVESSQLINNKMAKIKKEKKYVNLLNEKSNGALTTIERLPTGRVRYGPLVVNPRKKPSKTIFTGRHSKDEKLEGEAEEKRRLRRDRNRLAATKYRESREKVSSDLEMKLRHQEAIYNELTFCIERLSQRKQQLEFLTSQIMTNHSEPVQSSLEIVHPITSSQTLELVAQDQEQFQMLLTNSSNVGNLNDFHLNYQLQQQQQQQQITINSSSLNRLLDECVPPINTNDNNNNSLLFNSAYGTSTCAQQYSSSSSNEDDSMLSTKRNSYVC